MPDAKLYRASIKNHLRWVADGALDAEYYVLAPDFMSALVKADEILQELCRKLSTHKSVDGLRIVSLAEMGDIVDGAVAEKLPDTESWVEREARKVVQANA